MNLKVGDILWHMVGKELNGAVKFYVKPNCIEMIDEHKFMFSDGCGASINSIGKNYFLTKEEAEDSFIKKYKSFEQPLVKVSELEECIEHKERTDFQNLQIVKFDTVTVSTVYLGGFEKLIKYSDMLKWHSEPCEPLCMDIEYLTLTEIYEQVRKNTSKMITVFVNDPMECTIYQCGNYEDGKWVKLGTVMGYA